MQHDMVPEKGHVGCFAGRSLQGNYRDRSFPLPRGRNNPEVPLEREEELPLVC